MISKDDVKYIAGLARIHLEPDEIIRYTRDLEAILEYINKLEKLDVSEVEPTSHAISLQNAFRADEVRPSLPAEEVLSKAPARHNGFFKVPKVIES